VYETLQAEEQHRGHAIIEQLLADLDDGPLAHLPSGSSAPTPARGMAPRARMPQPLRSRLRATRRSDLTSPDPVRTPDAARQPAPAPKLR
jgi:hypothetical protein